ncbi:hypothetical protein [Macrococcus capreoli]|uniref:hypothetical protein n=1 Tax=Macrococcus capreoli TaxID=2982690 RepID=UPI003EE625A4
MSNKYYRLQILEETYHDEIRSCNREIDELFELKQNAIKFRERVYDKLQYLNSKHDLYDGFHLRMDDILMRFYDDINKYINDEIMILEDKKSSLKKSYNNSYDLILEEKDE